MTRHHPTAEATVGSSAAALRLPLDHPCVGRQASQKARPRADSPIRRCRDRRSDRTRELLHRVLRPVVDDQAAVLRPVLDIAHGPDRFDSLRETLVADAGRRTLEPLTDPETGARQNVAIERLVTERMRELPARDFSEAMRAATREDEWMLVAHGALFGVVGGLVHFVIFGA